MQIKAVIFDCDGTLVDSEIAHYLSWQYALQNQGSDFSVEEYYSYVGNGIEANAKLLVEKFGCDCVQRMIADKNHHYHQLQNLGLSAIQPTIDFIHRLSADKEQLGLNFGLASAARKEEILVNLRHLDIENLFDIILSGSDDLTAYNDPEGVNKPKPYIYLQAAKELELSPSQCIVIEDSATGVTASMKAGCFTIAVPNNYTLHQDLSHADLRIESFADIMVSDFLQMVLDVKELQGI